MLILGTCLLYLLFPPVAGIFATKVRVVEQLPLALILGTASLRRYEGSLSFEGTAARWFKPTPTRQDKCRYCRDWSGHRRAFQRRTKRKQNCACWRTSAELWRRRKKPSDISRRQ